MLRTKVIAVTLLLAATILGLVALTAKFIQSQTAAPQPTTATAAAAPSPDLTSPSISSQRLAHSGAKPEPAPAGSKSNPNPNRNTDPNSNKPAEGDSGYDAYVQRQVEVLEDLSRSRRHDAAALETILSELQNSDRTIRQAAREAIVRVDNRSVLPRLQELAAQTDDPSEKLELLDAIEYISLPSYSQRLAQQKTQ
jgi:hypothetical protein